MDAGSAFLGALIGGIAAGWLWFRGVGISTGRAFDLWVVPAPVGQAIGRLGCLAAACCHGKPTDSWLGLHLPDHDGFWAVRFPTQLLSAAADLLIFLILLRLERALARRPSAHFPGALTVAYLLLILASALWPVSAHSALWPVSDRASSSSAPAARLPRGKIQRDLIPAACNCPASAAGSTTGRLQA